LIDQLSSSTADGNINDGILFVQLRYDRDAPGATQREPDRAASVVSILVNTLFDANRRDG
jgi:hypothetical protein